MNTQFHNLFSDKLNCLDDINVFISAIKNSNVKKRIFYLDNG